MHRQGLFRSDQGAGRERRRPGGVGPDRATLPVPVQLASRKVLARWPQCRNRLVPGRAAEHGRVELCRPADRAGFRRVSISRPSGRALSDAPRRPRRPPVCSSVMSRSRRSSSRTPLPLKRSDGDRDQSAEPRRIGHRRDRGEMAEAARRGRCRRRAGRRTRNRQGDVEVPAPAAGTLAEILAEEGATLPVGAVLGRISEGVVAAAALHPSPVPARGAREGPAGPQSTEPRGGGPDVGPAQQEGEGQRALDRSGPAVRKLIAEGGLDAARSCRRAPADGSPKRM